MCGAGYVREERKVAASNRLPFLYGYLAEAKLAVGNGRKLGDGDRRDTREIDGAGKIVMIEENRVASKSRFCHRMLLGKNTESR